MAEGVSYSDAGSVISGLHASLCLFEHVSEIAAHQKRLAEKSASLFVIHINLSIGYF
ncbi:hypothetical protein IWT25_01473 [Secundilactobacillus pentosiphilus]|uniref:Uncharacterized protein n=1 Tax=Secundilactobacillus pentosiphilus TaxID=1714682 RepID=A0A1Z5IX34_9LACO|nr:hypothetical protein IWT25_01473 [Secundilactobacillus pentosiphilus]